MWCARVFIVFIYIYIVFIGFINQLLISSSSISQPKICHCHCYVSQPAGGSRPIFLASSQCWRGNLAFKSGPRKNWIGDTEIAPHMWNVCLQLIYNIWPWVKTYGAIFGWMNIHKSHLFWCSLGYHGFDPWPYRIQEQTWPKPTGRWHLECRMVHVRTNSCQVSFQSPISMAKSQRWFG